ncbi:copper amine oxidase N-terminal domain-containing protein [Paenibacillus sp. AK121]|uniref:stalk domain-containing protein n=1 Tax=Paenibacillus TaxID=44249 RepID=UPI001C2454AC|nr:stalk domain-containing protein [Paenibacillus sp. AK121]MBU9708645.1 copper amine oxidase N-terminal domain-containing protein [Paenibacillus sp. AK121]MEE4569977.1 stalk domain-containing protein [Paenibacillus polymyxa]
MKLDRTGFQRLFVALLMLPLLLTTMHQGDAEAAKQGTTAPQATQLTEIVIAGQPLNNKIKPLLIDGKLMVPLKPYAEAVGASYHWDAKQKQITLQKWAEPLILKEQLRKNQQQLIFKVVGKDVYVPLRDVSLELGYTLEKTNTQIQIQPPIHGKLKEQLYEGDLVAAREALIHLETRSVHPYIEVHRPNTELLSSVYMFPQGEALRYFTVDGDVLSLVEVKDDFPMVTYQGYMGAPFDNTFTMEYDPLELFLANKAKDQWGTYPKFNKPLIYKYTTGWGDSSTTFYGRVTIDKKEELLGMTGDPVTVLSANAKKIMKTFKLPWESRTDTQQAME